MGAGRLNCQIELIEPLRLSSFELIEPSVCHVCLRQPGERTSCFILISLIVQRVIAGLAVLCQEPRLYIARGSLADL